MSSVSADFIQLFREAQQAHQSGQLQKAASLYQQLIQVHPNQPDPYHMLGLILSSQTQYPKATQLFDKAISLNTQNPVYRNNIAEALQRMGQHQPAIQHLNEALNLDPNFYLAKQKLASILKKIHHYDQAETLFLEVINQKPDFEPAYFQLGTLMIQTGRFRSAIEPLSKAVELEPKSFKAYNNLAVCHQELEEFDEAIMNYQKALEIMQTYADALRNMALISDKRGESEVAKKYFHALADAKNGDPLIRWVAELVTNPVNQSNDEIDTYRVKVLAELKNIKSQKFQIDVEQLVKLDIHPPSATIYQGRDDMPIKQAYADLFKSIPKLPLTDQKNEKPHVVFLVTSGHEGVFLKCMLGILNNISTDRFKVSVACSLPNGASIIEPKVENPDVRFLSLPKSLGDSVKLLVQENIDFLHYWEVGTDAYNYFLPFFKPARFQATSWGWPVTSGNPNIDFFISSKGLDNSESQQFYTEKLILFEKLPLYYYPPKLPDFKKTKKDFGINEKAHLYTCAQNIRKVHPDFDPLVEGILKKDENAMVVVLGDKFPQITEELKKRFTTTLPDFQDRIKVLPRQQSDDYLELIRLSDVILDTVHYTGGANTNYDCFEVGTPVVTLAGEFHKSRYTATAYRQMGFTDLIADTEEAYVGLAIKLATDPKFRENAVHKIAANRYKVLEDMEAVKELEDFIDSVLSPFGT